MVKDSWPVIAEDFSQWVIEDNFCNGMPEWDKVYRAHTTGPLLVVRRMQWLC